MIIDISDLGSIISGLGTIAVAIFFLLIVLSTAIKVVPEYRRIVLFRLGRLVGSRGPGIVFIMPFIDRAMTVDLRILTLDVPVQEVITKDNVAIKVNAVVYFRVLEPSKSVVEVENYIVATSQLAQTTMRNVVGSVSLDELLSEREKLSEEICKIVDEATDPWGIKVENVELKDISLPEEMQRVIAKVAEAEREKQAVITKAQGEVEACNNLAQAANVMNAAPGALHLRTLAAIV